MNWIGHYTVFCAWRAFYGVGSSLDHITVDITKGEALEDVLASKGYDKDIVAAVIRGHHYEIDWGY